MVRRMASEDASLFLGCSGYPTCRATQPCVMEARDVQDSVGPQTEEEEHPASALWREVESAMLAGCAPEAALATVVPMADSPSHLTWLARKVREWEIRLRETPAR